MNVAHLLILLTLLSSFQLVHAQDPCSQGTAYRNCRACGTDQQLKDKKLNVLKNRDAKTTHPTRITVEEIRDPANNSTFAASRKVWVIGYVASIAPGGLKEPCNCQRADLRDIHINIVAHEQEVGTETKYVVLEFTPRWEKKFKLGDSDYAAMLQTVKDQIEHKWVKFEGWMLYDYLHEDKSESTSPGTSGNWRATPWEVHPVTSYKVVAGPPR